MINESIARTRGRGGPGRGVRKRLSAWAFRNQIGITSSIAAVILCLHYGSDVARAHTGKMLGLAYFNPRSGNYATGFDDFYLILSGVVLLTGLRASLMDYVISPVARSVGLSKQRDVTRITEQSWMLTYYSICWPFGLYIYVRSPYYMNLQELWTNWPQREMDGTLKFYILGQWAFWVHQVLVLHIENHRKDHNLMLTHHFVTLALIATCYAYHQTKVGHLILVLMDVVDLVFPVAKCMKYLGYSTLCDIAFGLWVCLWMVSRHICYLQICWSVYAHSQRLMPEACYRGSADSLEGPLPVPKDWSHLFEPFYTSTGLVCMQNNIMMGFLMFLLSLQVMMAMWSVMIFRVVLRVIRGESADDTRSDDEAEEETQLERDIDVEKDSKSFIEEDVDVDGLSYVGQQRRRNLKLGSASKVSVTGRDRHKEILNRIGCEKQID